MPIGARNGLDRSHASALADGSTHVSHQVLRFIVLDMMWPLTYMTWPPETLSVAPT